MTGRSDIESADMTSSKAAPSRIARRFMWLAAAIVLVIVGYSYAWSYGADRIVSATNTSVRQLNGNGRRANCENAGAMGYPFRIGVSCGRVMYEDARTGVSVRTQGLRTAAQIYDWSRIIAELDGPAQVEIPGVSALEINWDTLQSSVRLADRRPERVSVAVDALQVTLDTRGEQVDGVFAARRGEVHARPQGEALEVAFRADDVTVAGQPAAAEPFSTSADIVLDGLAGSLAGGAIPTGPRSGTIRSFVIGYEEAGLTASGPFEVAADGLLDAQLTLSVRNAEAFAERLATAFPENADTIRSTLSGVAMLGDGASLPLTIQRGDARLGFISLGSIPPLF